MDSPEATLERERCSLHPDRGAVAICQRCSRKVCLECAVPFRGEVRCERCAALELGDPEPPTTHQRRRIRPEHVAIALLIAGLAATLPPWHRSGTLTSGMSAWSFALDGWAALGCASLAVAAALGLLAVLRPARSISAAGVAVSALSTVAIAVALLRAPAFFSSTPAPFLALATGVAAGSVGLFSLVRRPRP